MDKIQFNVTIENLEANTEYYLRLTAVNKEGQSEWTECVVMISIDTETGKLLINEPL